MSNSDTRVDSILAALERFSSSLGQQTDQRIANLVIRLDQFENRFSNLEILIKASSNDSKATSITQFTTEANLIPTISFPLLPSLTLLLHPPNTIPTPNQLGPKSPANLLLH